MKVEKVEMYRTSDKYVYSTEKEADEHELYLWFAKKYKKEYGNSDGVESIFDFLMLNKNLVIDLYDKESNICP